MSKTEEVKKFLEELKNSEEGKKLLQEANSKEVILKVPIVEEEQNPKELVVEPNKEPKPEMVIVEGKNLGIKGMDKDLAVQPNKEDKEKKKDVKWWSKVFSKDKFKKTNKVALVYLRNNGNADLMEIETKNGFFTINNKTFHEDRDCVFTITKDRIPLIIVREWDLIPLGTKKWDDETMRQKFSELEQHVLKGIRAAEMVRVGGDIDSRLTPKQLILWGLAALVGVIIIMNFI